MCPEGVLNGCRAPRWKGNGYTCAECMPQNDLQSHSGQQVNFLKRYGGLQIHCFCCFPVAGGVGLRQYRVVRWLLLPETELRLRLVRR